MLAQGTNLGSINYTPLLVANLSSPYNETSGLVFHQDTIFSINDSGNSPVLHAMSAADGQHLHSWQLSNAQNQDWEALTKSATHLFIADVGNNAGDRSTRDIYYVPMSAFSTNDTSVSAQKQTFKLADQPLTGLQMNAHNFDCEALFYWQDSLHLFTKNWENLWTKHYVLPCFWQDTLSVWPHDSIFVDGLITDAAIDVGPQMIYLLGYKKEQSGLYSSFMYRFNNQANTFLEGDYQRIELGSTLSVGQTEGLCIAQSGVGYISSEQIVSFLTIPPKLHQFNFNSLLVTEVQVNPLIYFNANMLYMPQESIKDFRLYDTSGKEAITWQLGKNHQDLSQLKTGTYFLIGPNYSRTWVKTN
ncbi:MAG: T9SS type A sorting domain-containing protein [Flavobacteriales bacterium]